MNVIVSAVYVHNDDDNSWINLKFNDGGDKVYFDLLALKNGTKELSNSFISVDNYSKILLDVEAANANRNDVSTIDLTVPPDHIDVIAQFQISADKTTNVLLDMQTETVAISQSGNLKSIVKATVQYLS